MQYNPYGNLGYNSNIQPGTTGYSGISEVSSIDEVRAASVFYGTAIFMSNSSDIFYAKNSQGTIKAFKFEEIPIPTNDPQNFVTREEFENLRKQYEQLTQQNAALQSQYQQSQQPQSYADNAANAAVQWDAGASQGAVHQPTQFDEFNGAPSQPAS